MASECNEDTILMGLRVSKLCRSDWTSCLTYNVFSVFFLITWSFSSKHFLNKKFHSHVGFSL